MSDTPTWSDIRVFIHGKEITGIKSLNISKNITPAPIDFTIKRWSPRIRSDKRTFDRVTIAVKKLKKWEREMLRRVLRKRK